MRDNVPEELVGGSVMKRMQRQHGFTLVEIAVVLVIIGLLLGGVLKGQELIASARVRNLADQQAGIQAAYFGFIDRYRAVPGDMPAAEATTAIGETINLGANTPGGSAPVNDGKLSAPATSGGVWQELNGIWEQLSKSGFIKGSYPGTPAGGVDPATNPPNSDHAPVNVFNGVLILARHNGYQDSGTPSDRLLLHLGRNVPVDIARELDVKLDDGRPLTGSLRDATTGANVWNSTTDTGGATSSPCAIASSNDWNIDGDLQGCNPTSIF